ncbi:hypothetical protein FA95DRAFT_1568079, partial [Auriscalpium vulgare]
RYAPADPTSTWDPTSTQPTRAPQRRPKGCVPTEHLCVKCHEAPLRVQYAYLCDNGYTYSGLCHLASMGRGQVVIARGVSAVRLNVARCCRHIGAYSQ